MQKFEFDSEYYAHWDDVEELINDTIARLQHVKDNPHVDAAIMWLEEGLKEYSDG